MYSSICDTDHIDEAFIAVSTELNVSIKSQSLECFQCPLVKDADIKVDQSKPLRMSSTFARQLVVIGENNKTLCNYPRLLLVDQGAYQLNITHQGTCSFAITNSPMNANLPVYIALSVIFVAILLWILIRYLYKRGILHQFAICLPTQRLVNADLGRTALVATEETNSDVIGPNDGSTVQATEETLYSGAHTPQPARPTVRAQSRIHSIDTLRGLSLAVMVFVNYGGGKYWYFRHSAWNGLTVADIVFPWFVFVMGTSIALSFHGAKRRGVSKLTLLLRVLRRTAILFVLGLAISNHDIDVRYLRVFGVLQRLALTYCIVAGFYLLCPVPRDDHREGRWRAVYDLIVSWPLWLVAVSLLLIHTSVTFLLNVPDCPRGYLGPGGLHADRMYINCTGGASGFIDRAILTPAHMYKHHTCTRVYECSVAYDPEGILGTLTSVVLCILGVQSGMIVVIFQTRMARSVRWVAWAVVTGIAGGSLCNWSQEDGLIPVNKNLWSLSYILVLSSLAFLLVTVFYNVVDVNNLWTGVPLTYLGMNSIVIYVCHEVFQHYFPIQFYVANTHAAYLSVGIWGTVFWIIVAAYLYHKNIFIAI